MSIKFEIHIGLEMMHVVVCEIGQQIGILFVLAGNFWNILTYPQSEPMKPTYELISGTTIP